MTCRGIIVNRSCTYEYGQSIYCEDRCSQYKICVAGAALSQGTVLMYAPGSDRIVLPIKGKMGEVRVAGGATHIAYPNSLVLVQTYGVMRMVDQRGLQELQVCLNQESKPEVDTELEIKRRYLEKCWRLRSL